MGILDKFKIKKNKKGDAPTTMHPTTISSLKPKKSGISQLVSELFGQGKKSREHKWETTRTGSSSGATGFGNTGPSTGGTNGQTTGTGVGFSDDFVLPLIGHLPVPQQYKIIGGVGASTLLIALASTVAYTIYSQGYADDINASRQAALSLQLFAKDSTGAVSGQNVSLQEMKQRFSDVVEQTKFMSPSTNSFSSVVDEDMRQVEKLVAEITELQKPILINKDRIASLSGEVAKVKENAQRVSDFVRRLTLQINAERQMSKPELASLQKMIGVVQRINVNASSALMNDGVVQELPFQIFKDMSTLKQIISDFENGNEVRGIAKLQGNSLADLKKAKVSYIGEFTKDVYNISTMMLEMQAAKAKNVDILVDTDKAEVLLEAISAKLIKAQSKSDLFEIVALLMFFLSISSAAIGGFVMTREVRRAEREAKRVNDNNQAAIMRLLSEMEYLADGDLTKTASTADDFTFAIADSVNLAIEELRTLVVDIKKVADEVDTATGRADEIAVNLAKISEEQSSDIMDASKSVVDMSKVSEETSAKMNETAELAEQSVKTAERGSEIVHESIQGMRQLEGKIGEMKSHVGRLNANSESISDIVELISDITELTSVLAVNATIEASRAGDYGKGFTVVAKAVQDLASRAAEATRKIGALVDTVRTDIQTVVSAMEQTVEEVKENAVRSDVTGEALVEISEVSMMLADEIREMQNRTQEQSVKAVRVAEEMERILNLTNQAKSGTRETFESVDKIAKLAQDLNQSTSRFKV